MEDWKEYKLGDVCQRLKSGKGIKAQKISTQGKYPVIGGNGLRGYTDEANFIGQAAIIGRQGAYCGNVRYFNGAGYMTEYAIVVVGNELANTKYLSCKLSLMKLGHLSAQSAQPGLSVQLLSKLPIKLPTIEEQNAVAAIIQSLDDKIELNRRINDNLEQQAQALFNHYFVEHPDLLGDYSIGNLTDAANYLNGLAMQKFRPQEDECGIPVLKIKELGQGNTDSSSDICSENIANEYKVYDGDIIFSWSGTLMVKIWCGGLCGLNQHLFKVTSNVYPKWFYYFWTKYHLNKFIRIAQDKAVTMGHIKRGDLESSQILIPQMDVLSKLNAILNPLLKQIVRTKCESKKLSLIRDTLLPRLMSGELNINDLNR